MGFLYEPPINRILALLFLGVAGFALWLSLRRFIAAYRQAGQYDCALWIIRAIRCLLIALTAGAWSASFFWTKRWLFIIGLVIIGQELYEGAIVSFALRRGAKIESGEKNIDREK
ncbi:MAG: hypothetical protein HY892_00615 [Deltaproteobacteria bacterium]|nr:hypothetical protein [Deltaproteobacteria bacterium]